MYKQHPKNLQKCLERRFHFVIISRLVQTNGLIFVLLKPNLERARQSENFLKAF